MKSNDCILVKAPGRICVIGEHQDYLGLEVISGAMNLFVCLKAQRNESNSFVLHLKSMNEIRRINPRHLQKIEHGRDYIGSGLNVMLQEGFSFSTGYDVVISSDLPIRKGVSSSSALCVGWITLLSQIADQPKQLSKKKIARLAFESEVLYFNEPGGMQDHLASALGGLIYMNFAAGRSQPQIQHLDKPPGKFLLVDSGATKETIGMIKEIRSDIENSMSILDTNNRSTRLQTISIKDLPRMSINHSRLCGTIINRNLVREFFKRYTDISNKNKSMLIGRFMNTHHHVLKKHLRVSSEAIDRLCCIALKSGAVGAKVIGSGGGGCLLVYLQGNDKSLDSILKSSSAGIFHIDIAPGVCVSHY